ncbi:MAG: prepilin-type N-terminal cleavage/methylation domain-containing protein [Patescibacteria group bacterium]
MKSPNTSTPARNSFLPRKLLGRGFTLIETLIVIGIIGFVAVVGVIVGLDTYQRYVFRSDLDKTAALLQKARSSAINNVDEKSYGVRFDDPDNLILFRTNSTYAARDVSYDYKIAKSKTVQYDLANCAANEVIWAQLYGTANVCKVDIKDGVKTSTVEINDQGGINY